MIDERSDDAMVEIGDPEEEPTATPEPPPRVVIEYRDRGVPWMLVPPLLAAAAVVAVVVALGLDARWNPRRPPLAAAPAPAVAADPAADDAAATVSPAGQVLPRADVPEPKIVENPPAIPAPAADPKPAPAMIAAPTPATPPAAVAAGDAPMPPEAPPEDVAAPAPRVAALGFDPAAFADPAGTARAEADADPAARDRAVAQAAQPTVDDAAAAEPARPEQVDPALLPPDPARSVIDRQRRALEARRKLEVERSTFHTNLAAITRRLGKRAAPAIHELCQEFEQDIPVAAKTQAIKALGKTGLYAGANTSDRIALLRRLGFPEPAILNDLYDTATNHEHPDGRNTPSKDEMYIRSALLLLNHPPSRSATRPVSNPRTPAR